MDQATGNSSSLGGESRRGTGFCMLYSIRYFSLTEKDQVRITPEPPSLAKKTKFSWLSYMQDKAPDRLTNLLEDLATMESSMLRTRMVREVVVVAGCRNPFRRWPTMAKLKSVLKLCPMEWSSCLKCHSRGSRVSIIIFSRLWEQTTRGLRVWVRAVKQKNATSCHCDHSTGYVLANVAINMWNYQSLWFNPSLSLTLKQNHSFLFKDCFLLLSNFHSNIQFQALQGIKEAQ